MINDTTAHLRLPLPHADNLLEDDVLRLREALSLLDHQAQSQDAALTGVRTRATDLETRASAQEQAQAATEAALKAHEAAENPHHIPTATATALGLVKTGANIVNSNGTISVADASATVLGLVKTGTNIVNSNGLISVNNASTTVKGVVQLSSAVNSASETLAATAKAVKTAYDKAVAAQNAAAASGPSYDPASGTLTCPGYVGEFRNFMLATPPPGWAVRNGAVLTQADIRYRQLWAALNSSGMAFLKRTLEQWNALSAAAGGVGGVPFFVVGTTAKTIKLPDTRGDYERGAGSSYLETVGAWHPDAVRNASGTAFFANSAVAGQATSLASGNGVFSVGGPVGRYYANTALPANNMNNLYFNLSGSVPTAAENRTRTFGMLPCVYVGTPT